jgi:hypothetical protein
VRRRPSVRALARRRSGCERGGGGCRKIGFQADRKNRQQAVAHIFEQFAAVLVCGGNVSASVVKPRISDSQIAAWIASVAAADMAREHALAGILAHIGGQQITGDTILSADFGDARQRRDQRVDRADLLIGEAAGLARRP